MAYEYWLEIVCGGPSPVAFCCSDTPVCHVDDVCVRACSRPISGMDTRKLEGDRDTESNGESVV